MPKKETKAPFEGGLGFLFHILVKEGTNTATTIGCINEKGGTGKSTTAVSLGAALAQKGKRVLLVDLDPQASLTLSLGFREEYSVTINGVFARRVKRQEPLASDEGILHHAEGMDVLPSCGQLAHTTAQIGDVIGRENILRKRLEPLQDQYDYILIDCPPTLSHLTINAMTAAKSIIIPVEADYLSIQSLQRHLFTIPVGQSILAYAPSNPVSEAYRMVAEQILHQERQRVRCKRSPIR
jgi:chromosome partitioning protein